MNYNDKLKLAKEALDSGSYDKETIEYIFPELKESDDEKIRKALVEMVHDTTGDSLWVDYNVHKEDALAWLEKQGSQILANPAKTCKDGQKPTDKVEPKFKAGDKIISTISNTPYYITEVCNGHYLTDVGCIIMFNAQDNFELVEQKPAETEKGAKGNDREIPNSAWSEEDENMLNLTLGLLPYHRQCRNWLKSLKERYTWKPSESDIYLLERIVQGKSNPRDFQASLTALIIQLKKLTEYSYEK